MSECGPFRKEDAPSRECELCVSKTAGIFATRLFVKLIMSEEISGNLQNQYVIRDGRTLVLVITLKIDELVQS